MSSNESQKPGKDALATSLAAAIVKRREAAGLGMAELAKLAGMARAYLWRVEHAETIPSVRNLARLAVALNLTLSDLLQGVDTSEIELRNRPYDN
ncbi:XRE family transcriptional regulator [Erythrobacter litoralis]|uniref:helix-turn-helix domain-containing protein n=1 Tax=Erythrobacter litoralis TaxID=39960 RepID=UPI002435B574|nr:helix-turn-helix transcriptional regulator [Erythrobacter litoralis]MDG6079028.1 XRE family transcriptional regulator [Erythrobacter litoralis]